ncbi:hypothetical protein KW783_01095 [Candidatus Parcubacteria bacterium]|nr:hypothetical protein [Candidatus Parcubacteria bacterium]
MTSDEIKYRNAVLEYHEKRVRIEQETRAKLGRNISIADWSAKDRFWSRQALAHMREMICWYKLAPDFVKAIEQKVKEEFPVSV